MSKHYERLYGAMAAVALTFGLVGNSAAVTCDESDVTLGGNDATACGMGTTSNDTVPADINLWQVNIDNAGGGGWTLYEKEEEGETVPVGNTSAINLDDKDGINGATSGEFSLTYYDPTLIVLKDGNEYMYHWYLFEGLDVGQTYEGTWDASIIFEGKALSHMTAYVQAVPVPPAVWLFGSGLLGMVGVARRRKTS